MEPGPSFPISTAIEVGVLLVGLGGVLWRLAYVEKNVETRARSDLVELMLKAQTDRIVAIEKDVEQKASIEAVKHLEGKIDTAIDMLKQVLASKESTGSFPRSRT